VFLRDVYCGVCESRGSVCQGEITVSRDTHRSGISGGAVPSDPGLNGVSALVEETHSTKEEQEVQVRILLTSPVATRKT
jgi:hypothetical protein